VKKIYGHTERSFEKLASIAILGNSITFIIALGKTKDELTELSKEYAELAEQKKQEEEEKP